MRTLILKFGGAAVATPDHFSSIAEIIKSRMQQYKRLVVVVSAMGTTTDDLLKLANHVHPNPPRRELDMLISVGERISIALLAMALDMQGVKAISFTGSQSGIITSNDHSDARIVDVRPYRLSNHLNEGKVVIIAGFQGVSLNGEITTLGRGGSDTSAVALGAALKADKVEFYKDVSGIYTADPKKDASAALRPLLDFDEAFEIMNKGAKVLHSRSVMLAKNNGLPLHVLSFHEAKLVKEPEELDHLGTWIGKYSKKSQESLYEVS